MALYRKTRGTVEVVPFMPFLPSLPFLPFMPRVFSLLQASLALYFVEIQSIHCG
jgi:hypothetical protein